MTDVTQTVFHGHPEEISQGLRRSEPGAHFLIIYPELQTLSPRPTSVLYLFQ